MFTSNFVTSMFARCINYCILLETKLKFSRVSAKTCTIWKILVHKNAHLRTY